MSTTTENGQSQRHKAERGFYTIHLTAEIEIEREEPNEYIDEFKGRLVYTSMEEETQFDTEPAGQIRIYIYRFWDAQEHRVSSHDVFDADSEEMLDWYKLLFNPKTQCFNKHVADLHDQIVTPEDILILDEVEVVPEHRGVGLGLALVSRMIDTLSTGVGIVVTNPFPSETHPIYSESKSIQKLRDYWSKLGFKRIGRSAGYCLSMTKKRPALKTLCPAVFR
jgi:GNAT superfamily N-acetyltransferase